MNRREFIYVGMTGAVATMSGMRSCQQPTPANAPPSPDLQLNFEGLLAFAKPKTEKGAWSVIFVKTKDLTHSLETHWPVLRIRTASLDPGTTPPPSPPPGAPQAPAGFFQWDLTDTDVTILRGGSPADDGLDVVGNTRPIKSGKPVPCSTATAEQTDVSWLPDLALACGNGTLAGGLLNAKPGAFPRLGARVTLGSGTLSSGHGKSNVNAIWSVHGNYEQNFSDEVKVSVPARGSQLTIRLERAAQPTTEIRLKGTGGSVNAQFSNMVGGNPAMDDPRKPIDHFAAYYELLATTPTSTPIPQYKSECDGTILHGRQPADPAPGPLDPPAYCPPVTGNAP
jgi:hypothetical protein